MPRDINNVYQRAPGTVVSPRTLIESAVFNSAIDDLVADANTPRPQVAGGTGATSLTTALNAAGAFTEANRYTIYSPASATEVIVPIPANAKCMRLHLIGVVPSANGANMTLAKSTDGVVFNNFEEVTNNTGVNTVTQPNHLLSANIGGNNISNVEAEGGWNGTITLYNLSIAEAMYGNINGVYRNSSLNLTMLINSWIRSSTATIITHVRIKTLTGSIKSGTIVSEKIY